MLTVRETSITPQRSELLSRIARFRDTNSGQSIASPVATKIFLSVDESRNVLRTLSWCKLLQFKRKLIRNMVPFNSLAVIWAAIRQTFRLSWSTDSSSRFPTLKCLKRFAIQVSPTRQALWVVSEACSCPTGTHSLITTRMTSSISLATGRTRYSQKLIATATWPKAREVRKPLRYPQWTNPRTASTDKITNAALSRSSTRFWILDALQWLILRRKWAKRSRKDWSWSQLPTYWFSHIKNWTSSKSRGFESTYYL